MTRRLLPWLAVVAVVAGALGWAAASRGDGGSSARARAQDLASELRCPDCEGLSVADSPTSTGRAIRREIAARITRGQGDAEIRQAYVDRYGESILLKPEGDGLGLLVWGLPVAAVALGGVGLLAALRRWRREPRAHATPADETLVARARGADGVRAGR